KAELGVDSEEITKLFLKPKVTDEYMLEWRRPNEEKIRELLVEEHQFSLERVNHALERAVKAYRQLFEQTTLESWFG
ncbi:MAG: flap structure-specific endonuclease, partial [Thermoprotei archaeon]